MVAWSAGRSLEILSGSAYYTMGEPYVFWTTLPSPTTPVRIIFRFQLTSGWTGNPFGNSSLDLSHQCFKYTIWLYIFNELFFSFHSRVFTPFVTMSSPRMCHYRHLLTFHCNNNLFTFLCAKWNFSLAFETVNIALKYHDLLSILPSLLGCM